MIARVAGLGARWFDQPPADEAGRHDHDGNEDQGDVPLLLHDGHPSWYLSSTLFIVI
jgi:hypothetical protein